LLDFTGVVWATKNPPRSGLSDLCRVCKLAPDRIAAIDEEIDRREKEEQPTAMGG
jgi:hypothetical protein